MGLVGELSPTQYCSKLAWLLCAGSFRLLDDPWNSKGHLTLIKDLNPLIPAKKKLTISFWKKTFRKYKKKVKSDQKILYFNIFVLVNFIAELF